MTEAELAELDDPEAPNVPEALPGAGLVGPGRPVSAAEARTRRATMSEMLAQGMDPTTIIAAFAGKYQMTESAIRALIIEVRAMWDDEDAEAARYAKGAARRRLLRSIREASKDRKWTAVANLENVLSGVEGTNVNEDEQPTDLDSRLSDALLSVLGVKDTKEVRILIERERTFIELGKHDGTAQKALPGEIIVEGG